MAKYICAIPMVMTTQGAVYKGNPISSICKPVEIQAMLLRKIIIEDTAMPLVQPVKAVSTVKTEDKVEPQTTLNKIGELEYKCDLCGRSDFASLAGFKAHYRNCALKHK